MSKIILDLAECYPAFAVKVQAVLDQANRETKGKFEGFVRWGLFETYRTPERQKELYAQGRTKPGQIVTYLQASRHSSRLAVDVVWYDEHNVPRWDGAEGLWSRLGHAVRSQGLEWGGDWKMRDTPHIEPKPVQYALWLLPAKFYKPKK